MKAPKRHPKSSKTSKPRDQKMNPKIINFWTNFGPILGAILGPKWAPKLVQNLFFFGARFWTSFVDFEILEGRPAVARRYTLSGKVPRAASRAVLFYQLTGVQHPRTSTIYQASNGSDTPWPKGRRIVIYYHLKGGIPDSWSPARNSLFWLCLLYTSPSPRDLSTSRMPSSA